MDRFTLRGIIFSAISAAGIAYEVLSSHPVRILLILGYVFVIGVGMIYIFVLKDNRASEYSETEP